MTYYNVSSGTLNPTILLCCGMLAEICCGQVAAPCSGFRFCYIANSKLWQWCRACHWLYI